VIGSAHSPECVVLVSNLPTTTTDSGLKRECIESVGRPKFIYMHVNDSRTGVFSGAAIIEFSDPAFATKACDTGVLSCPVRRVTTGEFESLTMGDWPMLDYGPPQGVFGPQTAPPPSPPPATPAGWARQAQPTPARQQAGTTQQSRPSNPWQK
jgi:hypothetical protein